MRARIFFAQLVGKPNPYGQLLSTAHGLSSNQFGIKKISKNTVDALIILALGLNKSNP